MSFQGPHTNVHNVLRCPRNTMGCARGAYVLAIPSCSVSLCIPGPGLYPFSFVTGSFASPANKCIDLNKWVCTDKYNYCTTRHFSTTFSVQLSFN